MHEIERQREKKTHRERNSAQTKKKWCISNKMVDKL